MFLKDIINLIPAKHTWGGATAKFNTCKIYLEGAAAKFNTRETQKFCGFLEPRNLVPKVLFSYVHILPCLDRLKVYSNLVDIGMLHNLNGNQASLILHLTCFYKQTNSNKMLNTDGKGSVSQINMKVLQIHVEIMLMDSHKG